MFSSDEFDSTLAVFSAGLWLDSMLLLSVFSLSFADSLFSLEVEAEAERLLKLAISGSVVLSEDVLVSCFDKLEAFFFDLPFLLVLALFSAISIVVFDLISSRTIGVCLFSMASLSGFESLSHLLGLSTVTAESPSCDINLAFSISKHRT